MSGIPDSYFDRFTTPKYQNRNPLQRWLIRRFVARVQALFLRAAPGARVLEIGCGQGFLSGRLSELHPHLEFTGVDLSADDLAALRREFPRVETVLGDANDLSGLSAAPDLLICCEVLEHLEAPDRALDQMLRLIGDHPAQLLLSVPHEPWFQLSNLVRGKNLARLGNDAEHVNRWGRSGFAALLAPRFELLATDTAYPWQLALARPR